MTEAYPLQWPDGWARTPSERRTDGKFSTSRETERGWSSKVPVSMAIALERLEREADLLGARYPVLSTNVELTLRGAPRSGAKRPDDPGAAFWFDLRGKPHVLACDRFRRVEDNVAGIAAHIYATRAIERYGVATASQMYAGFEALPPPSAVIPTRPWWDVLDVPRNAPREDVLSAYRTKAKRAHPDAGGSHEQMAEINAAMRAAKEEMS